jgi:hypothetical protein
MKKMFLLACAGRGVQSSSRNSPVKAGEQPVMEQFRLAAESGLWDFFDRIPGEDNLDEYLAAVDKYGLPALSGSRTYQLGKDENLIESNLKRAKLASSRYHNLMIWARHADGHLISNEEVADSYLRAYDMAAAMGLKITYEVHVDMWSEDVRRIVPVAKLVEARGVPFNFCMDYSHCIFKIENEVEQAVAGLRGDAESIRRLDPFHGDSFCDEWLDRKMVHWTQVRPVAPNGPPNWLAGESGPFGGLGFDRPGRSIQYPFVRPGPGEWHGDTWHAHKQSCTKEVIRKVIDHYLRNDDSPMEIMTIDNINLAAYGEGWRYNMFEDSCAVAKFVRETYAERAAIYEAELAAGSKEALVARFRP